VRSRRKGVAEGLVPNLLPLSKLAVVEYATELLLEDTESEWNPAGPPVPALLRLRLRLDNWRQRNPDPFSGQLVRGLNPCGCTAVGSAGVSACIRSGD
jgi:hypothetical protein